MNIENKLLKFLIVLVNYSMMTKFEARTPKYAIPHTNVVFFFCSMNIVVYAPDFNLLQMRVFMLIFH